jgi:DNA-binding MarR family transcriptional regulator
MISSRAVTASPPRRRDRPEPDRLVSRLPEALQFMRLLWALVHGLQKSSKRMRASLGVTGPQRLVLRVLGLWPGLSAGALAETLHVHPSTLTGILARLMGQGLITRAPDDGDRRRTVLRLTSRGARINASRRGTVEAAVTAALQRMTPRERAAMQSGLASLTRTLDPPQKSGWTGGSIPPVRRR